MNTTVAAAIQSGLSLRGRGSLHYLPPPLPGSGGGYVGLSLAAKACGIHRTTLVQAVRYKKIKRGRFKDGRWELPLEALSRYVLDGYRYSKAGSPLGLRAGRWWSRWELVVLGLSISHETAAKRLGRTPAAVKVKRCKLRRPA